MVQEKFSKYFRLNENKNTVMEIDRMLQKCFEEIYKIEYVYLKNGKL